jgi:pimeloyl-ACP methyl ester carboxylesterase
MKEAIIIIGGYNSLWPTYLRIARDLEDITGLQAIGVPLMPWHWWLSGRQEDATNILQKLEETVHWARRRLQARRFIIVGHSAGGVIARLYLSEQPVWGRVYAGQNHTAALITLGSPHCCQRGTDTGWFLTDEANRLMPAASTTGQVRCWSVAGQSHQGREDGTYRERQAFRAYRFFTGQGGLWGDGIVPIRCASLEGAEDLILNGVAHSAKVSSDWYGGSKAIIRRWWPEALKHAH